MNASIQKPSLSITKQRGYITDMTYLEQVNPRLIRHIIDEGLCAENYDLTNFSQLRASTCHKNERAQLEAYLLKYKKKDQGIHVKYSKARHGNGRVFPVKSLGLTTLSKKTRNTLIKDTMIDIDMSNAQPAIILNLCKANNIPCEYNERYNLHREEILAEVVETYGVTRDDAKGLFIRLAFSGQFKGWSKDCGLNVDEFEPTEFIKGFTEEIRAFAEIVKDHNPELYKCAKDCKAKKGDDKNILGSMLATFLQEYEFRIADTACEFLDTQTKITTVSYSKLKVLTYEFDGLKLPKDKVREYGGVELLISTLEKLVLDKTGFQIKFEEKPITKFFNVDGFCESINEISNPQDLLGVLPEVVAEVVAPVPIEDVVILELVRVKA